MNDSSKLIISKQLVKEFLSELHDSNDAIYAVMLSTSDGHNIDSVSDTEEFSVSKIAAMTSSCLALSEKLAAESNQRGCEFVNIQNENGYLIIKRLYKRLVVTVASHQSTNLGMLLSTIRNSVGEFETKLGVQK